MDATASSCVVPNMDFVPWLFLTFAFRLQVKAVHPLPVHADGVVGDVVGALKDVPRSAALKRDKVQLEEILNLENKNKNSLAKIKPGNLKCDVIRR